MASFNLPATTNQIVESSPLANSSSASGTSTASESTGSSAKDQLFFKLGLNLKDQLVNQLNQHTFVRALIDKSLTEQKKLDLFENTNKLITALNDLSVLENEKDDQQKKRPNDTNVDCDTLLVIDLLSNDDSQLNLSTADDCAKRDCLKKCAHEIDIIFKNISKFDPAKMNIRAWLMQYESFCVLFEWTDEERVLRLPFFLDHGLINVVSERSFNEAKFALIAFVDTLLAPVIEPPSHQDIKTMLNNLMTFKFKFSEQKHFLTCFLSESDIRNYYVKNSKEIDNDLSISYAEYYKKYLSHLLDF